jgi:FMN-dependent NADH-azoreductase
MVIVQASGGVYSTGANARLNYGSRYLEDVFGFIGIELVRTVHVEGTAIPQLAAEAFATAQKSAAAALTEF